MSDTTGKAPAGGERLAKIIARSGLCSRRDAEAWIKEGRVTVNSQKVLTPAFNVSDNDKILVDGSPLAARQGTRVWLYHKPAGLVVTEKDPEGRETIFEALEKHGLPRVVTIGRLDINTEGLLLLTNDGGLKRVLELPATGWLRKYRVRAFGSVTQAQLDGLKQGVEIEGVKYGPIEAIFERQQGANSWLQLALREGKNREVKNVLGALGLQVNRLIRISFGPFQLNDLAIGAVETVKARVLREQLGKRLSDAAGVDFDSDMPEGLASLKPVAPALADPRQRVAAPGKAAPKPCGSRAEVPRFKFTDRTDKPVREQRDEDRPRRDRPGRVEPFKPRKRAEPAADTGPARTLHFDDGRDSVEFKPAAAAGKPERGDRPAFDRGDKPAFKRREERPAGAGADRRAPAGRGDRPRPAGGDGERPKRPFPGKPRSFDGPRPPRPEGARPPRPGGDDRPKRSFADRPARSDGPRPPRSGEDRPKRSFSDRPPRPDGPRPPRPGGPRPPRPGGDDRPQRSFAGKPARTGDGTRPPRPEGGPKRSFAGKPRPEGGARPPRKFDGDKPRGPRKDGPTGSRPPRKPRPA